MATNLTLMQQFLTLFNHILAKWHSFAHSALLDAIVSIRLLVLFLEGFPKVKTFNFLTFQDPINNNFHELCFQVYCSSLSTCIPSMCNRVSVDDMCPRGYLSCGIGSCVQNQCLALVLNKERIKQFIKEKR